MLVGPEQEGPLLETAAEKAERLNNSALFDVHRWSDHPEVNHVVNHVFELLKKTPAFRGKEKSLKKHLKVVLLDLYVKWQIDPSMYVAISRDRDRYKPGSRYNALHIGMMAVRVVDALQALDLIEQVKGVHGRTADHNSYVTRIRAKEGLVQLFKSHQMTPDVVAPYKKTECIVMRDQDKIDVDYEDTPKTTGMRRELLRYNNFLRQFDISLSEESVGTPPESDRPKIDLTDTFVRRIFNNGRWGDGGRFYGGWWQTIPKEWRSQILINGGICVEFDYQALHIKLLYAMNKLSLNEDAYQMLEKFDGYSSAIRPLRKLAVLIALNAEAKHKIVQAIRYKINQRGNEDLKALAEAEAVDLEKVVDAIPKAHPILEKYIGTGIGIKLQNLDSQIATTVIGKMMDEGALVLCLHDSFIARWDDSIKLERIMEEAYKELFEKQGFRDSVTIKPVGSVSEKIRMLQDEFRCTPSTEDKR